MAFGVLVVVMYIIITHCIFFPYTDACADVDLITNIKQHNHTCSLAWQK